MTSAEGEAAGNLLTVNEFKRLYFGKRYSMRMVAKHLNTTCYYLYKLVKKNNIELRNKSQAIHLSYKFKRRDAHGVNNSNYKHGKLIDAGVGMRWSKYGITRQVFEKLRQKQKNKCAICKEIFKDTPNIDHCHKTNRVRGLLCNKCNGGLGLLRDNTVLLKKAIEYLINN